MLRAQVKEPPSLCPADPRINQKVDSLSLHHTGPSSPLHEMSQAPWCLLHAVCSHHCCDPQGL